MTELVIDHLSSRWDRSPRSLRNAIMRSAKHASIITLTEVYDGKRPQALTRIPGYAVLQDRANGDMAEVAVLYEKQAWKVLRWQAYVIGPDLGPGNRVIAILALLENLRTGETVLVTTAHLPSAVEGAWTARGRRVLEYQKAVLKWRRIVRRWRKQYRPTVEVACPDWNLDYRQKWVRAWIKGAWPALKGAVSWPNRGTHGYRLIDWPIARGLLNLRFTVLPPHNHSDHRGIRIKGTIPGATP